MSSPSADHIAESMLDKGFDIQMTPSGTMKATINFVQSGSQAASSETKPVGLPASNTT